MSVRHWLLAYDITDKRRLQRVHRAVSRRARRVQYSLYEFDGTSDELRQWLQKLLALIDAREDKLRVLPSPRDGRQRTFGAGTLPGGIFLFDDDGNPL